MKRPRHSSELLFVYEPPRRRGRARKRPRTTAVTTKARKHVVLRCSVQGCSYVTHSKSYMWRHMAGKHRVGSQHRCHVEGCRYTTTHSLNLKIHLTTHNPTKQYPCGVEGCSFATNYKSYLPRHRLICHSTHKPLRCDAEGCDYATACPKSFAIHCATHQHEPQGSCSDGAEGGTTQSTSPTGKLYRCRGQGCTFVTAYKWCIQRHTAQSCIATKRARDTWAGRCGLRPCATTKASLPPHHSNGSGNTDTRGTRDTRGCCHRDNTPSITSTAVAAAITAANTPAVLAPKVPQRRTSTSCVV